MREILARENYVPVYWCSNYGYTGTRNTDRPKRRSFPVLKQGKDTKARCAILGGSRSGKPRAIREAEWLKNHWIFLAKRSRKQCLDTYWGQSTVSDVEMAIRTAESQA